MKFNLTLFSKSPVKSSMFVALALGVIGLSSCSTDHDDIQIPNRGALSIVNASPTKGALDFYIDNQKVNNSAALNFGSQTGYYLVTSGSRTGKTTLAGNAATLHSEKIDMVTDQYQSLYIVNAADSVVYFNTTDKFAQVGTDKAQVRFINLSPNSPSYSLEIEGDTTAFTNKQYKQLTPFKVVNTKAAVKVNLKDNATNAIVASISNVELKGQNVYTIWAKGTVGATVDAQKSGIEVTKHVQNF